MSRRKQTSGGQAIVMVTLALIAMCGMMGLAVDLGWSFFVQKQAQAAADGAALAAVHEAWQRLNGTITSVSCPNTPGGLYCDTSSPPKNCNSIKSDTSSNLWNGCLYAINDGFTSGGLSGRQDVTIQANITGGGSGSMPLPPVSGIPQANIAYWATVRTVQTIPQLFSSVLGNTQGTVSAIATAAIAAETVPGSFYGLNQKGDCLTNAGGTFDCGVDMDLSGAGNVACRNVDGTPAGVSAKVCAPAGIYLASTCSGGALVPGQCTGNAPTGKGFAGETNDSSDTIWAQSIIKVFNTGAVSDPTVWSPKPSDSPDPSLFQDPAHDKAQPPLVTPASAIGTCALPGGTVPAGSNLGPYQYFSYTVKGGNGLPLPDGNPITINKANVAFSTVANGGSCPISTPGVIFTPGAASAAFPAYIFYGGMNITNNNQTVTFGPGQYVMAGTSPSNNACAAGPCVFTSTGGTLTGDNAAGTMFIFTDGNYPGLSTQEAGLPNPLPQLTQGLVDLKNSTYNLYGISQSASPSLTNYENYLFWSDRRNSTDKFDPNNTPATTPASYPPNPSQNVTATSPTIILDPGNASMTLRGVSYQPEGAWLTLQSGTSAIANSHLQIITGALINPNGGGNTAITLLGPDKPTIIFVTTLIQ